MITTILTFLKANKIAAMLGAGALIVAAIIIAIMLYNQGQDRLVKTAKDAGAAKVTSDNMSETINRVEKANEARDTIRTNANRARYDQCLRTARTPANCQRFMPDEQAD